MCDGVGSGFVFWFFFIVFNIAMFIVTLINQNTSYEKTKPKVGHFLVPGCLLAFVVNYLFNTSPKEFYESATNLYKKWFGGSHGTW